MDEPLSKLAVIVGPTAVGKTDISIKIAEKVNGEIISADSMLVYKNMNIGTAKPSMDERKGVLHHLVDVVEPYENYSVADFKELAERYIYEITKKNKLPIVVGGTGLYINSLLNNYDFTTKAEDLEYRNYLKDIASKDGTSYLHEKLKDIDIEAYDRIHSNDLKRIVRALEVYHITGKTITYYQQESKKLPSKYNLKMIGLIIDRSKLYDRINKRVDNMVDNGLVEEVKALKELGCNKSHTSMQGLGYKEILEYLDGELSLNEAIEKIKIETRHFAKRQLSWFRRDERIKWFEIDAYDCLEFLIKDIINYMEN